MTKVVYASLKSSKPGRLFSKEVRGSDGRTTIVHTVDANSPTFGEDLTAAFRLNVRKARRENKRLMGSADRAPAGR